VQQSTHKHRATQHAAFWNDASLRKAGRAAFQRVRLVGSPDGRSGFPDLMAFPSAAPAPRAFGTARAILSIPSAMSASSMTEYPRRIWLRLLCSSEKTNSAGLEEHAVGFDQVVQDPRVHYLGQLDPDVATAVFRLGGGTGEVPFERFVHHVAALAVDADQSGDE